MQKWAGRGLQVRYVEFLSPGMIGSKTTFEISTLSKGGSGALPPMTPAALLPLTARSNGLDNVDGGPDAAFYIQIGII
jgi:hypothetical protein